MHYMDIWIESLEAEYLSIKRLSSLQVINTGVRKGNENFWFQVQHFCFTFHFTNKYYSR